MNYAHLITLKLKTSSMFYKYFYFLEPVTIEIGFYMWSMRINKKNVS